MIIEFIDETETVKEEHLQLINELLSFAADHESVTEDKEISVSFVTNESIKSINKTYRNKDQVTDVLSFAMLETNEEEILIKGIDEVDNMLGDIIISVERAKEQAEDFGHRYERELGFLALHGLLHILGYDHIESEDEVIMTKKQEEILDAFGLSRD